MSFKRLKILRKISAIFLILLIAISNTLPALANGSIVGDNGGGGSGNAGYSDDYKAWSSSRQGYRFYIIDNNFIRVSPVYDFCFTDPAASGSNIEEAFKDTRFDEAGSPDMWQVLSIKKLAEVTGSSINDIPLPVKDNKGHGEELKAWLLRGLTGSGGVVIPHSSLNQGSSNVKQSNNKYNNNSTSNGTAQTGSQSALTKSYINMGKTAIQTANSTKNVAYNLTDKELQTCKNSLGIAEDLYDVYKSTAPDGLSGSDLHNYAMGRTYKALIKSGYNANQTAYIIKWVNMTAGQPSTVLSLPNIISRDILKQNIPLAGPSTTDESTSIENAPIIKLLGDNNSIQVPGFESAAEALFTGDYYLVIEPITWLNLGTAPGQYNSYRTYGSYYNIACRWQGNDNGGFYKSYMTSLGNNCLIVAQNHETSSGKEIQAVSVQTRNISQSVAEMNSKNPYLGLSMHIYTSGDMKGDYGVTIIKNYIDENGDIAKDNVIDVTDSTTYNIEDEGEYKVVQWQVSNSEPPEEIGTRAVWSDITAYSSVTNAGNSPQTVQLVEDDDKAIFIQLQINKKELPETEWILQESEISKMFDTTENPETMNPDTIDITMNELDSVHAHEYTCDGCEDTDEDGINDSCNGHTDYFDMELTDDIINLTLENSLRDKYPNLLALKGSFKDEIKPDVNQFTRPSTDVATETIENVQYKFIGHRGEDKLKLAKYKDENTSHIPVLSVLGYQAADKATSPSRNKPTYISNISFNLRVKDGSDIYTTSTCDRCGEPDTDEADTSEIDLNSKITVKVYRGQSTGVNQEYISKNPKYQINPNNNSCGRIIQESSMIKFYPNIRMTYMTLNSDKKDVYVLGDFERKVLPNSCAEIAWGSVEENLRITSNQWSTHASTMQLVGPNCGLPGGALFSVDTKTGNKRIVYFNTYQTIVPDDKEIQASTTIDTDEYTEEGARNEHEAFVMNGITTLENSYLKMYVNKNKDAENAWDGGIEVYNGANIKSLNNGSSTASTDSKYYFKQTSEGADLGTFDTNELGTNYIYHRVYSDTEGNVYYKSGTSLSQVLDNSVVNPIFGKKEVYNKNKLDEGARRVEARTLFIKKYMTAIERNTGNDTTASWNLGKDDGCWYNEAYKGIIVLEQVTQVEVGLVYPATRTTVMDTKLIPKQTTKSDRDENGKVKTDAFLFQFKSSLSENDPISTFKGQSVFMRNADLLFKSNKAYIINMTVQDLS